MTWEDRINVVKIDFCLSYIRLNSYRTVRQHYNDQPINAAVFIVRVTQNT
jgi:hypothetical protein